MLDGCALFGIMFLGLAGLLLRPSVLGAVACAQGKEVAAKESRIYTLLGLKPLRGVLLGAP